MIYEALEHVTEELNGHLRRVFGVTEDRAVISCLINQDGTPAMKDDNKLLVTLVNIMEEKMLMNNHIRSKKDKPSVNLNLYVLFSTSFIGSLSGEALKFISATIGFFQKTPVFYVGSSMVVFEIYNANFPELANIWATLGGKYTPSILYKARMIEIDEDSPTSTLNKIISK